jgi:hypothetical protein
MMSLGGRIKSEYGELVRYDDLERYFSPWRERADTLLRGRERGSLTR